MNKLDGKTSDIIKDNIQKLKELFPEVISESKIDFDTLRQYLGDEVEEREERYSFNWHGKKQAISMAIGQSTGTLRPDKESSKDWDTTKNLFIEGDNLEVMRILRNTYLGKVKMIYIDPPYNTGKDFVYTDNFKDNLGNYTNKTGQNFVTNPETNGRYHTNWLNMMYPRLRMAKDLLREDGVIFISIDDNEVHNLRKICDEIFGEENFVANMVWQSKSGGAHDEKNIVKETEYILVYSKNKNFSNFGRYLSSETDKYKLQDELYSERGGYLLNKLDRRMTSSHYTESLNYPIELPNKSIIWPGGGDKRSNKGWNWRWSKTKLEWGLRNKFIDFVEKNGIYSVYSKQYEKVDHENNPLERTYPFRNLILSKEFSTTQASSEMIALFGFKIFEYAKSSQFMSHIIKIANLGSDDIVLDFFAGSGTTAHAVMQLNAEDGGNRKYIMVQLDEETDEKSEAYKAGYKTIAELARERIRRAGEKIITDNVDKLAEREFPLDIGFKAFRLDSTNLNIWDGNTENIGESLNFLANNPIKENRTEQDIIYEILLKAGIDITIPIQESIVANTTLYSIAGNMVMICLTHHLTEDIIQAIAEAKPEKIVVYDNAFINDAAKLNAEKIWTDAGVNDIRTI